VWRAGGDGSMSMNCVTDVPTIHSRLDDESWRETIVMTDVFSDVRLIINYVSV
jgi:hypothetical protein